MCLDENPDRARARARPLSPSTNRRPAREVKRADAPRDESTHLAVKMFANDKHLPGGFRLLARQKPGLTSTSRPVRAPVCPASIFRTRGDPRRRAERRKLSMMARRCSPRRQTSSRVLPTLGASRRYVEGVSLHLARGGRLPDPSPDSTCRYRSSPRTWSIPSPCCTATPAKEHKVSPLYLRNCSRLYGNA